MATYFPKGDQAKADMLDNLANKIPSYTATLGLTPAEVASVQADAVEVRYILVPVGEMPPEKPSACPEVQDSKKAQFKIHAGIENAGKRFYGFFRWVNTSISANSGLWTKALRVVIA